VDSMTQSPEVGELVAAIAAVTGAVGYVQKTGRNTHHRYTYASDEDLARAIGPELAAHGLAIMPHRIDTTRDGDRVRLVMTWRIAHSSGQWMTIETVGEGCDKQDKAAYKAMTGARKYLLRLVFCIATGDDAEVDTPTPSAPAAPSKPRNIPSYESMGHPHHRGAPSKPSKPKRKPRAVLIDAAKEAAGDDAQKFTRWVAAINAQPDRLLPTLAQRIGKVDDVGAALDKLKVKQ